MCHLHRLVFAVKDDGKHPCVFKALKGGFKPFKYKVSRIKHTALRTAGKRLLWAYSDIPRFEFEPCRMLCFKFIPFPFSFSPCMSVEVFPIRLSIRLIAYLDGYLYKPVWTLSTPFFLRSIGHSGHPLMKVCVFEL